MESAFCNRHQSQTSDQLKQFVDRLCVFIRLKIRMLLLGAQSITFGHPFDFFFETIFYQPESALVWHRDASPRYYLYCPNVYNFAV